jgi:flagellar biosynthesis protein FliR
MFSVTYAQLNGWLTAFFWPLVRLLALIAVAPVVGHSSVPVRVKIGLVAFMALVIAPTLGPLPQVTVFSADGVWILVNQFLIGIALGLAMQLVFAATSAAGDFIGLQMGLGFASFYDPMSGGTTPALGQFLNSVALLTFLACDGHLQMFAALADSFRLLPVSADLLHAEGWRTLAAAGAVVFQTGLLLSLPVVAAVLIANLVLGILNRAAPQIGVFQVGFPITLLVGLLLVQLMIPNMIPFFARVSAQGIDLMGRVTVGFAPHINP